MNATVKNAANEGQVKTSRKQQKIKADQDVEDIRQSLKYPHVRRMVWRWIGLFGIDRISFTNSGYTNFNEGERNAAIRIKKEIIEADKNIWLQMEKEALDEEEINEDIRKRKNEKKEVNDE